MNDPLSAVFLTCFLFGVAFSVLSLVTGTAHHSLPGGHALHLGHGLHTHGTAHMDSGEGATLLNVGSLLAFLTWFGGIGFLLRAFSPLTLLLVIPLALVAGLAGAALILVFLVKVLVPAQTTLDPEQYRLEGTIGRITATILPHNTGEITYAKAGTRRSDAARSIEDEPIAHGEEVVILRYRHGVAYVQSLSRFLTAPSSETAERLAALDAQSTIRPTLPGNDEREH